MRLKNTLPLKAVLLVWLSLIMPGCASLHHVQIGEIDSSQGLLNRIEVAKSATGLNVSEGAEIGKVLLPGKKFNQASDAVSDVWKMLTFGPKTGEVTFTDTYADALPMELMKSCPSGRMTGLMVVRETNKYPVISGEIVRLTGYCIQPASTKKTRDY